MASSVLARVRQPAGQLPPGVLIPGVGALAKLPGLVVFGQLVGLPPPLRVFRGIARRTGHRTSLAKVSAHPRRVLGFLPVLRFQQR